MTIRKVERGTEFDYVVYKLKEKIFNQIIRNEHAFEWYDNDDAEYPEKYDVYVTQLWRDNIHTHRFYKERKNDAVLTKALEQLRKEVDLERSLVVSFHRDNKYRVIRYCQAVQYIKDLLEDTYYEPTFTETEYYINKTVEGADYKETRVLVLTHTTS